MTYAIALLIAIGVGAVGGFRERVWIMVLPCALPIVVELVAPSNPSATLDDWINGLSWAVPFYLVPSLLGAILGSLTRVVWLHFRR
ncbi:hypothetical protein AB6806_10965 [Bosea sp. RCC_152_1]|uniref:hypothetical protein n=1 Tax=Bosea sp. RCC_152_1 TaxID=3239228 RepID=UPI0035259151